MTEAKRHHQVPVFYLRRFANGEQIQVVTRRGRRATAGIRDAAVAEHFYSYVRGDGTRATDVEAFLAEDVDSPSAPAFDRLALGAITADAIQRVVRFMAFQVVRSPRFRDLDRQLGEHLGPILYGFDTVREAFNEGSGRSWNDDEAQTIFERARADPPTEYTRKPDVNSSIRIMLRWIERLEGTLRGFKWCVAVADEPVLITIDNPVAIFRPAAHPSAFHGVQPDEASEVRFPLDPQHLLLGAKHALGQGRIRATDELVLTTNALLCRECCHAAFHKPGTEPMEGLRLAPTPPALPEPTIHMRPNPGAPDTPAEFPELADHRLADLIERTLAPPP